MTNHRSRLPASGRLRWRAALALAAGRGPERGRCGRGSHRGRRADPHPVPAAEGAQQPGPPAPVGSFSVTQLGDKADKVGKDTNFRGLTIFNNVVYYTKGSGGNGVNTVYFIDTTGHACPNGTGLPVPGASLPASAIAFDPSLLQTKGVTPYNMCVLQGFPTALKSTTSFPFGLWFANRNTLYVADEGNGDSTFTTASARTPQRPRRPRRPAEVGARRHQLAPGLHPVTA